MDLELKGRRALVTGSSSGIGAAIAAELAAEGVSVVVHGRDRERAALTAAEVSRHGVEAAIAIGDLATDEGAAAVAEAATAAFDGIDILVNNAGAVLQMNEPDWLKITLGEWFDSYNLNVGAAVRLSQRLSPAMVERGWGRIVNISSVSGSEMRGRLLEYGAAKSALNSFTVNLSKALGPTGVTVNCVIPGTIITPAIERWIDTLSEQRGWAGDFAEKERAYVEERGTQAIPRLGRPREIAVAVAWLASPLSAYTTGAFLRVEGGLATTIGA
ncbi:MAG TPA: SDR family NAD(P)-dependent oxidoreductase [Novosphingobium sp.]|nr:SDR family NAD(P)-dependent oxidoreductase [Novosphingobium sp.]